MFCMRLATRLRSDCGAWTGEGGGGCAVHRSNRFSSSSSFLSSSLCFVSHTGSRSCKSRGCMPCISRVVSRVLMVVRLAFLVHTSLRSVRFGQKCRRWRWRRCNRRHARVCHCRVTSNLLCLILKCLGRRQLGLFDLLAHLRVVRASCVSARFRRLWSCQCFCGM